MSLSRGAKLRKHRAFARRRPKLECFVYSLRETENSPVRYVGQTRQLLSERLRWHMKAIQRKRSEGKRLSPAMAWVAAIFDANSMPVIEMIDAKGIWDITEAVWIDRLLARGEPLLNVQSVVPR